MDSRKISIAENIVNRLDLDLNGLTVITECASGDYLFTPLMAAMAGAEVYALGKDTRFGTFQSIQQELLSYASDLVLNRVHPCSIEEFENWHLADIMTNSGLLRPIHDNVISRMKKTAVIPLMWETWEFRDADLDIKSCQKYEIPVIGTYEGFKKADMYAYPGLMAIKILIELQAELANSRIVLLGGGLTGELIAKTFNDLKIDYYWFTQSGNEKNRNCFTYESLDDILFNEPHIEAILFAEHTDAREIIGNKGFTTWSRIANAFPHVAIAHICGNVDRTGLKDSGLRFAPSNVADFGYMSFLPNVLSPYPVMLLNAAGLKVGEIAARKRLEGASVEDTIEATISHGIGQDFEGGFLNYG